MAKNVNFDTNATLLPKVASPKIDLQRYFKLYPEKWTWILQLPMFVDSETVV